MELQWPLILFTTFVSWSAGVFAAQGALVLKGAAPRAQLPALICSAALLVAGGVAVFFHLEHWERIFNGFGHLTSGITQELVAIVVMALVMVVYFAQLRRSENGSVPTWIAVLALISAALLVVVMGNSYLMAARPAWDSALQICSLIGVACVLGPATLAVLEDVVAGDSSEAASPVSVGSAAFAVWGSVINLVTTGAFLLGMTTASSSLTDVGYSFDPTRPEAGLLDLASISPFAGESALIAGGALVAALLAVIVALLAKTKGGWKSWGALIVVCAFACTVLARVVFYQMGVSVFLYY